MIIKRDFIYSPKGKNRPLHIWLPDDYGSSDRRYPVMYFLTGTTCSPMRTPPTESPGA